jgi:hypothetical protein
MEFVEKAQTLLVENALYVGIGLFVAVLLAAVVWYYMSRGSSGSGSGVLANQARMNMVNTDVPSEASQPDPMALPSEPLSQEELEKQLASIGNMNQGEQQPSE